MDGSLIWKMILVAGSVIVAMAGSLGIVKWKHDNKIEEALEDIIETQIDISIDLSPTDPDPSDSEIAGI